MLPSLGFSALGSSLRRQDCFTSCGTVRGPRPRLAALARRGQAAPQGRLENQGLVRSRPTLALALTACAGVACAISLNPYCLCRAGWSRCMRRRRSRTTRSGAGQGISGLPMRRSANPWSVDQSMIATKDASPPGRAPASMQRWTGFDQGQERPRSRVGTIGHPDFGRPD
jgi:hypothetical protein